MTIKTNDLAIANKIIEMHCQTIQELTAKLNALRAELKRIKEGRGGPR
jgi:hypothetical protein